MHLADLELNSDRASLIYVMPVFCSPVPLVQKAAIFCVS